MLWEDIRIKAREAMETKRLLTLKEFRDRH
jgi:hypothetical protein